MAGAEEGATHDRMVKTPMTQKCLHNMSLDSSLEDLQGPIHETLDLSTNFLIQMSISVNNPFETKIQLVHVRQFNT